MAIVTTQRQARNVSAEDTAIKMKLEGPFAAQLRKLFREIGFAFAGQYTRDGSIINLEPYRSDFEGILRQNYRKIAEKFGYRLIEEIDEQKQQLTENEKTEMLLDAAIAAEILNLSVTEASLILDTTQRDIQEDISNTIIEAAKEGESLDNAEVAERSRKKFVKNSKARSENIAVTETESMAELSKETELDTLALAGATIGGIAIRDTVEKTWVTVGDSKVRLTHRAADMQTVSISQKFSVGGEQLKQPGDPAASPENRINCRCNMVISKKNSIVSSTIGDLGL